MARPLNPDTIQIGAVRIRPAGERWRLRWVVDGKPKEKTVDTLDAAKTAALDVAVNAASPEPSSLKVSELIAKAIDPADRPHWGPRYIRTLHSDVRNHILPAIGTIEAGKLSRRHCADLLNTMAASGYSTSTVSRVRKALKKVAAEGALLGVWPAGKDPMAGIKLPVVLGDDQMRSVETVPTDAQAAALCHALTAISERDGLVGNIARFTGLRYSEIMGLQAHDVKLDARELTVKRQRYAHPDTGAWVVDTPKTKAGTRVVAVDAALVPTLRDWIDSNSLTGSDFLVTNTRDKVGISFGSWSKIMNRARSESGYPEGMGLHALRHYAATRWLRLGASAADVARMLGHSSPLITLRIYTSGDTESTTRMKELLQ